MDEIDFAILNLAEALARGAKRKDAEKLVAPLEKSLRVWFRKQGKLFVKKLRGMAEQFEVAESDPFLAHAVRLNMPLREAVSQADWDLVWFEVSQETADDFAGAVDKTAKAALEIGMRAMAAALKVKLNFKLKNPRAQAYLDEYGARLVKNVDETTREYLQTLLSEAMKEGWSYQQVAEAIVARFEEFAISKPQEHIFSRAHLIAVTEMGNAYAEGNLIVARNLKDAGLNVEKSWSTVGDDKVSQGCLDNEADGWIEVDEAFSSGDQRPLRFPGCRCDLLTRIKE